MKLFSEIYGAYYRITEKILQRKTLTRSELLDIIRKYGFSETVLFLAPQLMGKNSCGLLREESGIYRSILKKSPQTPLTALEKQWLCAVLQDPRSGLFLDVPERKALCRMLGDKPLFQQQSLVFFDRYSDGDNYENAEYIRHFRNILRSLKSRTLIRISFQTRAGKRITHYFLPVKMEYSSKNDCFRVHVIRYQKQKAVDSGIINLSRITLAECTDITPEVNTAMTDVRREALVRITEERNAVNRFMMEFAELERISEYDENTKQCFVRMWYDARDEIEILIRLLSFGPVIEVMGPVHLREQMRERVNRQGTWMHAGREDESPYAAQ